MKKRLNAIVVFITVLLLSSIFSFYYALGPWAPVGVAGNSPQIGANTASPATQSLSAKLGIQTPTQKPTLGQNISSDINKRGAAYNADVTGTSPESQGENDFTKGLQATGQAFGAVTDVGGVVAESVYSFFRDAKNKDYIKQLIDNGVAIQEVRHAKKQTLKGAVFVLTGSLETLTRDEAKMKIRALGGDVASSVSKNTSYVVAGSDPGSKFDTAQKLGVAILRETDFLKLIN